MLFSYSLSKVIPSVFDNLSRAFQADFMPLPEDASIIHSLSKGIRDVRLSYENCTYRIQAVIIAQLSMKKWYQCLDIDEILVLVVEVSSEESLKIAQPFVNQARTFWPDKSIIVFLFGVSTLLGRVERANRMAAAFPDFSKSNIIIIISLWR